MPTPDPRVDAYIAKAAPFARPILKRLREVVHAGCPEVVETMKWSMPHFECQGPLCGMAAFKQHATFGFWKASLLKAHGLPAPSKKAMGQFGCLTSVDDLPDRRTLVKLVKAAAALNEQGIKAERPRRAPKPALPVPPALAEALARHTRARKAFDAFSPSHRREYIEWIAEAKGDDTRARRIAQAIAWIAEGKSRNWKYARPASGGRAAAAVKRPTARRVR